MIANRTQLRKGFTLVEMAIVLGVVGLLVAGLWRLVAAGNGQMKDQAAASLHAQVVMAVNSYLQTDEGQSVMALKGPNGTAPIMLPAAAGDCVAPFATFPANTDAAITLKNSGICNYLPPGFLSTTTNSYGQTFLIAFRKDASNIGIRPSSYSFAIATVGGDPISDTAGGRISGLIGGDGGFLYTSPVCSTAITAFRTACGSYGSWSADLNTLFGYPLATLASGHVASRSYYSPMAGLASFWLAHVPVAGDTMLDLNTMRADLFMGMNGANPTNIHFATFNGAVPPYTAAGGNINMYNGRIYLANSSVATGSTGRLEAQGGTINMGGGIINAQAGLVTLGNGSITDTGRTVLTSNAMSVSVVPGTPLAGGAAVPFVQLSTGCSIDPLSPLYAAAVVNCQPGISVSGDYSSLGRVTANSLYAQTFVYQASDRRLKTDIKTLINPMDDLMKIDPVSYKLKATGMESMGVIAQDIEKIYPQLVVDKPDGMKAVNYEGLIAPLIGAVQELKKENDALRVQLRKQEERQDMLEKKLGTGSAAK